MNAIIKELKIEFSKQFLVYSNFSFKDILLLTDGYVTNSINKFNQYLIENVITKYPQLNDIIKKSGQTPVVLFAGTLLLILLSFAMTYLLFFKHRRKKQRNSQAQAVKNNDSKVDKESNSPTVKKSASKRDISPIKPNTKVDFTPALIPQSSTTSDADSNKISTASKASLLDIDGFIRKLRQTGLQVQRKKNDTFSNQILRMNAKGEILWSNSIFTKPHNITTLISAFEADDQTFLLDFKKRALIFKLRPTEHSYTVGSICKYFDAIIKKQHVDPHFAINICKSNKGEHDNHAMNDDASSVASDSSNGRFLTSLSTPRRGNFAIVSPTGTHKPSTSASSLPPLPETPTPKK